MKTYDDKDLKRLLTPTTRPRPPADLLAKLKDEVPESLQCPATPPVNPSFIHRVRPYLPFAATLAMMVGGGMIAWQVMQDPPDLAMAPVILEEEFAEEAETAPAESTSTDGPGFADSEERADLEEPKEGLEARESALEDDLFEAKDLATVAEPYSEALAVPPSPSPVPRLQPSVKKLERNQRELQDSAIPPRPAIPPAKPAIEPAPLNKVIPARDSSHESAASDPQEEFILPEATKAKNAAGERSRGTREGSSRQVETIQEVDKDSTFHRQLAEFGDEIEVEEKVASPAAGGLYQGRNEGSRLLESEVHTSFVRWYYLNEALPRDPDPVQEDGDSRVLSRQAKRSLPSFEPQPSDPFILSQESTTSSTSLGSTGFVGAAAKTTRHDRSFRSESSKGEDFGSGFDYREPGPAQGALRLQADGMALPWSPGRHFYRLRFALMGREQNRREQGTALGEIAEVRVVFNPEAVIRWRLLGQGNGGDRVLSGGEAIPFGYRGQQLYDVQLQAQLAPSTVVARFLLRFTLPEGAKSEEKETLLRVRDLADHFEDASPALQLSTLAAQFAELQRRSYWAQTTRPQQILTLARDLENYYRKDVAVRQWLDQVRKMDRGWSPKEEGWDEVVE